MSELPALMLDPEILRIATTLEEAGFETWCVGGALRDRLLGDDASDVDLATSARPEEVQRLFRRTVPVGIRFGTVGVLDRRSHLHEVTTFRSDVSTDGRHAVVAFGASLDEDLARRDFTMNAMAYHPIRKAWYDPLGGERDIAARLIRAVGLPSIRFREDYLRILRAIRFAARFGFTIEAETWEAARSAAPGLEGLSAERVREEWFKGLSSCRSIGGLVRLWHDVGAAAIWIPELSDPDDLPPSEPPTRDPVVLTVVLCRNPDEVLRRLRGSNREVERAARIVTAPKAPERNDEESVRRWLAITGDVASDLAAIHRYREGVEPGWWAVVERILQREDPISRAHLAVRGHDLLRLGAPGGPLVGELLDHLLDRVLEDPSRNTREQLLDLARRWLDERRSRPV